jgi:hypothetical protein
MSSNVCSVNNKSPVTRGNNRIRYLLFIHRFMTSARSADVTTALPAPPLAMRSCLEGKKKLQLAIGSVCTAEAAKFTEVKCIRALRNEKIPNRIHVSYIELL